MGENQTLQLKKNKAGNIGLFVDPHYASAGPEYDTVLVLDRQGEKRWPSGIPAGIGYWDGAFHPVEQGDYIFQLTADGVLQAFEVKDILATTARGILHAPPFSGFLRRGAYWFWEQTRGYNQTS